MTLKTLLQSVCALMLLVHVSGSALAQGTGVTVSGHQTYAGASQYSEVYYHNGLAFIGTLSTPGKVFIANASNAALVGTYSTSNSSWVKDLQAQGNFLYVALDSAGIDIVDITVPATPVFVTRFNTSASGVHDLFINGPTLYYVDDASASNLHIVNVTNPASPQAITTFDNPGGCHDLTVRGMRAYLANGDGGFQILDVSNPAAPVSLGVQTIPGSYTHNIWPSGDGHYVCTTDETCGTGILKIWDVSNLPTITFVSQYGVFDQGNTCVHNGMWVDDRIYMSYYRHGLRIIDVTNPVTPFEVADYPTFGGGTGCFVGAWGIFADRSGAGSTNVYLSDIGSGLWSFAFPSAPNKGFDGVATYVSSSGAFFLRDSPASGVADTILSFGPGGSGFVGLSGDWNGDGTTTIGAYNPATSTFFLRNSNSGGGADAAFQFGAAGGGYAPVVGDWDGDGIQTVGLYLASTGTFFLRNSNSPGPANAVFSFGPGGGVALPVVGDWDATRTDTVGVYVVSTGVFFLKNSNASGAADVAFQFGPGGAGFVPLAGNWDGVGGDTIGIYAAGSSTFFVRNANSSGPADLSFSYGAAASAPLSGDWKGPGF